MRSAQHFRFWIFYSFHPEKTITGLWETVTNRRPLRDARTSWSRSYFYVFVFELCVFVYDGRAKWLVCSLTNKKKDDTFLRDRSPIHLSIALDGHRKKKTRKQKWTLEEKKSALIAKENDFQKHKHYMELMGHLLFKIKKLFLYLFRSTVRKGLGNNSDRSEWNAGTTHTSFP